MSRLAKKPIQIPSGVEVTITATTVVVKGPKGTLQRTVPALVTLNQSSEGLKVLPVDESERKQSAMVGLWVRLLENMINGVTKGFERVLEVSGIGYKIAVQGRALVLDIGFSHQVTMPLPEGIEAAMEKNVLTLRGNDKEIIGQFAKTIRSLRPPEPYKGKGIKFQGEIVRRKAGKAAKAAGAK